jgi:hypothetical protein
MARTMAMLDGADGGFFAEVFFAGFSAVAALPDLRALFFFSSPGMGASSVVF